MRGAQHHHGLAAHRHPRKWQIEGTLAERPFNPASHLVGITVHRRGSERRSVHQVQEAAKDLRVLLNPRDGRRQDVHEPLAVVFGSGTRTLNGQVQEFHGETLAGSSHHGVDRPP